MSAGTAILVGIFVGGRARRMGGVAKGLLAAPGSTDSLIERLLRISHHALGAHESVLVGRAPAYAGLALPFVEDAPSGVGPLGGLCGLLETAVERRASAVIALACDLPHVSARLIEQLGSHAPAAAAVAPRPDGIWQPLVARYDPERALQAAHAALQAGERALHCVLDRLGTDAVALPLAPGEVDLLRDWDEPSDLG